MKNLPKYKIKPNKSKRLSYFDDRRKDSLESLPKIKENVKFGVVKGSGDVKKSMGQRMAVKMNKIGSKGFAIPI